MFFSSDNWAGAAPEVIEAIARANDGYAPAYGDDPLSERVMAKFSEVFEHACTVFFVTTGGAANSLALSTLTPPYGMVLCHDGSHVQTDECGGPEFFTGGAKIVGVQGQDGKITPDGLTKTLTEFPQHPPHSPPPSAITITQGTECGTLYDLEEIAAIGAFARENNLHLHMDGARFANAVASSQATPAELTWKAGVDVLSFGGTKNGCIAAEAVVFFNQDCVKDFEYRRKRAGHLWSKSRYIAAQFDAYLNDELWLKLAGHANQMAKKLSNGLAAFNEVEVCYPTQINEVFAAMPPDAANGMRKQGAVFYPWTMPGDEYGGRMNRMIASFRTTEEDVDAFLELARINLT